MFFTQDDYKKIYNWILRKSVKDTEFNEANIPFNGNEIVSIVQGNQNKKVFLKDLVSQIFNLGVSDFINISEKYDAYIIDLEEAIKLIPYKARKKGQVISFLNKNNHWSIYQFVGALNQWNVLDQWKDLFDLDKTVINSILPDEEDLTKSLPDENGNSYLSLKDREYNPNDFSGLGRVILRKNIVEIEDLIYGKVKKNILNHKKINKANTVYEIRYDYDLNGQIFEIPSNCTLNFKGGSFSNGTIIGNKTKLINTNTSIFKNITLLGSYDIKGVYVEWFRDSSLTDSEIITKAINNAVSSGIYQVYLAPIQYNIDSPITIKVKVALTGVYNGTRLNATNENVMLTWSGLTDFCDISNIYFCGYGGKAIYNESYDYASTFHIHDCQFDAELEQCIRGNFILSTIDKCHFGYYGTPHPNHGHITIKGNTSGPMSNINKITDSRFYRSTANYSCIFEAGIELLISKCNFETNNNKVCTIKFAGANTFEVEHCWFEHCLGDYIALITSNSEGYVYGNYVINFNNNYFYMNNANKEIFYLSGSSYSVEFVNNFASNFTGKYITYDGVSYDNGVKTFYNNTLWPNYSGNLKNKFNLEDSTISSKGLVADPWFKTWSLENTNDWVKSGIKTWEKYSSTDLGEQYKGGVKIQCNDRETNCMYIQLPLFLVRGKKLRIEAIYKEIIGATGAAFQIGYDFTSNNPTYMQNIGDYMQSKNYAKVAASIIVPSDAEYCNIGIVSPGCNIEFVLKAFDIFVYNGTVIPTLSNESAGGIESNTNVEHATFADTATTAHVANKAIQDESGNNIESTYATKHSVENLQEQSNSAIDNSIEALNAAITAKNAIATLDGLANSTTAQQTLANQVLQIEENKQNIGIYNVDISSLSSRDFCLGSKGWYIDQSLGYGKHTTINVENYSKVVITNGENTQYIGFVTKIDTIVYDGTIFYCNEVPYRLRQEPNVTSVYDVPSDAKYLVLGMEDGAGTSHSYINIECHYKGNYIDSIYDSISVFKSINVDIYPKNKGVPDANSSNGWYIEASDPDLCNHIIVPTNGIDKVSCLVKGYKGYIAFVTQYTIPTVNRETIYYSNIYPNRITIDKNSPITFDIPEDAKYLIIVTKDGGGSIPTWDIVLHKIAKTNEQKVFSEALKLLNSNKDTSSCRLKIMSWNVGHFCNGTGISSSITSSDYLDKRTKFRNFFNEEGADIIGLVEYSDIFNSTTGETAISAILNQYKNNNFGSITASGYVCNGIVTNAVISSSNVISLPVDYYAIEYKVSYMGSNFVFCVAHLPWQSEEQNVQAVNTLVNYYQNTDKVIIVGDFNVLQNSTYNLFTSAGYNIANCGYMGDIITYPSTSKALDNILVKGGNIIKTKVIESDLSDHYPIIADISI